MNKINNIIGDRLSSGLSSMTCFWIVSVIVVVPLAIERPSALIAWIQYLSTTILQASALPLLGYTSMVAGEKQQKLLQETHDTVMEELKLAQEEREELSVIVKELHEVIKREILN